MAEVKLSLNLDSLLNLPTGASYNARSGRANVQVSKGEEPGQIIVYASCDSLQRLVNYYEEVLSTRAESEETDSRESSRHKESKARDWVLPVIFVIMVGAIPAILINKNGKMQ